MRYLVLLTILMGCGMKHKVEGHVSGDATVRHQIDLTTLRQYFENECRIQLSENGQTPTQQEINECVNDSMSGFFDALEASGV